MKRAILIALLACTLLGVVAVLYFRISLDRNREQRLLLLTQYENAGKTEVAQGLLWGLLRDFPSDATVLDHLNKTEQQIEDKNQALALKWREIQENFDRLHGRVRATERNGRILDEKVGVFKSNVEGFQDLERQYWVEQVTVQETTAATDYLYQLLKEKRNQNTPLSATEIEQHLVVANEAIAQQNYTKAKTESVIILRSEPINAQAATIWCFATVSMTPESADNQKRVLPVVEYIVSVVPNNQLALQTAAMIYQAAGSYSLAEERYRKAYEIKNDSVELMKNYVDVLISVNKLKVGLPIAMRIWDTFEKSDATGLLMWRCLDDESDQDKQTFLKKWQATVPSSALPDTYMGEMAYTAGDKELALSSYQAAERKRPSKAIYQRLVEISLELRRTALSMQYLHVLIKGLNVKVDSGRQEFLKYGTILVETEFAANLYSEVLNDADIYLKVDALDNNIRLMLGRSLELTGDISNAISMYEIIYKSGKVEAVAEYLLAALYKQKKYKEITAHGAEILPKIIDPELKTRIASIIDSAHEQMTVKQK